MIEVILAVLLAITISLWSFTRCKRLESLAISLHCSPNQISAVDIVVLIIKATLKHIPGYSPGLHPSPTDNKTFTLPAVQIAGKLRIFQANIDTFNASVNAQQEGAPSQKINPFFLVAQTVPLTISILAHRSTPIKPLGAVNTRNIFEVLDPAFCRDSTAIKSAADAGTLSYEAYFGGPERPGHRRKRGVEFCILIEVSHEGNVVLRQECWFLQFLSAKVEPRYQADASEEMTSHAMKDASTDSDFSDTFRMDYRDPKRWAASSKDYNPIHVSGLGARLFGFRAVIAHGNHVAALALEQLGSGKRASDQLDPRHDACELLWNTSSPFVVEAKFVRPMILPAEAKVEWSRTGSGEDHKALNWSVSSRGKVCLEGEMYECQHSR